MKTLEELARDLVTTIKEKIEDRSDIVTEQEVTAFIASETLLYMANRAMSTGTSEGAALAIEEEEWAHAIKKEFL